MFNLRRRLLNTLGAALIIAMCAVVALLLQHSRRQAIDDLGRDTRNLTTALALNARGIVASIDLALVGARDSLALLEHARKGTVPLEVGNQVLCDSVARLGLPVLMRALDAQGHQMFSSEGQPYTPSSRDRDFFSAHLPRDAGLFISQPFVSRINGKWAMVFSRRIEAADGQFKGVILVGTPLEVFESLFERFDIGAQGTLILADDNGLLLARRPARTDLVGKKVLRDDGALARLRAGTNAGVRISHAPVDSVERMLGFERIGATRLVVGVGQGVEEWLANWRREAVISGTVTLLFGALALLMMSRTARHARQATLQAEQLQRSEERMRSILAHAPDAFIAMDHRGLITDWNRQAEATFGWKAAEVVGRPVADVVGLRAFFDSGTEPVVNLRIEVLALHRDGHEIPVELSIGALRTPDGFVATAFLHDISERKEAAANLAASNRRLRAIADNLPVLVSYIDKDERLRFCNWTWREWLGVDPAAVVGRRMVDVIGPALYEQRRAQLRRALAGEQVNFEVESLAKGVSKYLRTVYIPDVQADGTVAGVYAVSTDITTSKQMEMKLDELAHVDALTGLPNRRRFDERLREAVARSHRGLQPMALMVLDVDHFKQINDRHGHTIGDAVLKEFARRLQRCLRITDTVARYGGDEFVVILEGLQANDDAARVARKICDELRPPFALGDRSLSVTTSIGATVFHGEAVSPADAVERADKALYEAKRAGRDTFVVSHSGVEI